MLSPPAFACASLFGLYRRRKRRIQARSHVRSQKGRRPNSDRDFVGAYNRFYKMYLSTQPTYTDDQFRRRFRVSRGFFLQLVEAVGRYDSYFAWKRDATGRKGVHPTFKVAAALRMLAYGCSADSLDETFSIAEATVNKSLKRFVYVIIAVYGHEHLRLPTRDDIRKILDVNASRGFPGMVGSIDFMKWQWKNCPSAWRGSFLGASKKATVVLEAVATADLHIWHAFVGVPGSHNDINVLDASPLITEYIDDKAPEFEYKLSGKTYNSLYWLADGIYPNWKCFAKTISSPVAQKQKRFTKMQEGARKDIERAFGVLQTRFAIVTRPSLQWDLAYVNKITKCSIILHNMIISDDSKHNIRQPLSVYAFKAGLSGYKRHRFRYKRLTVLDPAPESFIMSYSKVMSSTLHF